MLVSEYFRYLRRVIDACEAITTKEIVEDERSDYYQDENDNRIFRYDNTEHFPDLSNFPHHNHTPKNVIASSAPTLKEVLKEIMQSKR